MASERDAFVGELKRWRDVRGMSQSRLARAMGYDRSYISKIESGADWPAPDFARRADDVLAAGGALRRFYARQGAAVSQQPDAGRPPTEPPEPPVLVVEHDEATLCFDGVRYRRIAASSTAGPSP